MSTPLTNTNEASFAPRRMAASVSQTSLGRGLTAAAAWVRARVQKLTLARLLREDPVLRWGFLLLAVASLLPLAVTPILPLVDLGSNVGAASLLAEAAAGSGTVAHHYEVFWFPIPYWTAYALMALGDLVGGPYFAAKLIVAIVVLLIPLGVIRLLHALGRDPRLGLWAFLLSWDTNLFWGWVTFQLGMALALFALAILVEAKTAREALRAAPIAFLVALTHPHAVVWLGVAGIAIAVVQRPVWKGLLRALAAGSGAIVGVAPLFVRVLLGTSGMPSRPWSFEYPPHGERFAKFYEFTLDNVPTGFGQYATSAALVVLLLGPLLLCLLPRGRDATPHLSLEAIALLAASGLLYVALPFSLSGPADHWWTYPRFGSPILISLLTLPPVSLRGRAAWALLPGAVTAVALDAAITRHFAVWGDYVEPYTKLVEAMRPDCTFLPLDLDNNDGITRRRSIGQVHGYAAAEKKCYDPHLFEIELNPLHFREDRGLPHPNWRKVDSFEMNKHGRAYDYIIVHPLRLDPLAAGPASQEVRLVLESGNWRLYEVLGPQPSNP